jgi:16S rRNA (cytidine1402-2'-O)-methyltransferase
MPALLVHAAAAAAGLQQYPPACLYVLATPIGNFADLSLRAIHVLSQLDALACEDTRVTAPLLQRLGLSVPLLAVHEHNEAEAAERVIGLLRQGQRVGFASDAGTPAVSDPGARLVAAVRADGLRVMPLPGASSVSTVLSAAGAWKPGAAADAAAQGYRFAGFMPAKGSARAAAVTRAMAEPAACVLFEAPHRIRTLADELAAEQARQGQLRQVTIGRELTKQFEQIETLAVSELAAWLSAESDRCRGEFALVLHPVPEESGGAEEQADADAQRWLVRLLPLLPLRQAVDLVAEALPAPRKRVYQLALALREAGPGEG